jgi:hypothetical protein
MLELQPCKNKWVWSLIFVRIPKNASTSVFNHLGNLNLIKKHEKAFEQLLKDKTYRGWFSPTHAKPNEIYRILGNMAKNYVSFAIVRNPYDRMVSMYHFAIKNKLAKLYGMQEEFTFQQFCEILLDKYTEQDKTFIAIHPQADWLEGAFEPNFVLRFENLEKEFDNMLKQCNIQHINPELPRENSSERGHYHDYFDFQSRKITEKIFEKDFDLFKYNY